MNQAEPRSWSNNGVSYSNIGVSEPNNGLSQGNNDVRESSNGFSQSNIGVSGSSNGFSPARIVRVGWRNAKVEQNNGVFGLDIGGSGLNRAISDWSNGSGFSRCEDK